MTVLQAFPDLATNLVYTVLCLVPGFVTVKTVQYTAGIDFELDQIDRTTWSMVGSGLSLSVLYFLYVVWVDITTARLALVVSVDLTWTQLVAIYPVLLAVALCVGYVLGRGMIRFQSRLPMNVLAPPTESNQ